MSETPDRPIKMIESTQVQLSLVTEELERLKKSASNASLELSERLEAYEDIIASEVGDTLFTRARNIEREIGLRQIYLKFEGGNPSGTQKDRIAFTQVEDALRRGYNTICIASCGNYGVAISFAASLAGINCHIYIPENYHTSREKEIINFGGQIIRQGSDYEESVVLSSKHALEQDFYDANPGGSNTVLQLKAYGEIAFEIYDELRDAPAAIAVPVSNGTTLSGIYRGFQQLYRRGKTSRIPRIIAGSSSFKNPIISSFKKGLTSCEDLIPSQIKESIINEPLINWHSIDGDIALEAIYATNGWAKYGSDKKMIYFSNFIKKQEGLSVLPASTAGLIALTEYHNQNSLPGDRYVVVLTGRR
jgi:threonine synthase